MMFWRKRRVDTLSKMPRLLEAPSEDDENATGFEIRERNLSILTTFPSEIDSVLSPTYPFEGPEFTEAVANIDPSTVLALRNRCSLRELIDNHAEDVIDVLKNLCVVKLGSFKAKDSVVLRAFGANKILTRSLDLPDDPYWQDQWKSTLEERNRNIVHACSVGWEEMVSVSAYAVQLRDIAKTEDGDLCALLLKKTSSGAAPSNVWGFPAVRAVIDHHWQHWAQRLLFITFVFFMAWALSYAAYIVVYIGANVFETTRETEGSLSKRALLNTKRLTTDASRQTSMRNITIVEHGSYYGAFSEEDGLAVLTYIFALLSFVFMLPFAIEEYWALFAQGNDWISWRNVLDVATNGSQGIIFMCHLSNMGLKSELFGCLLALQTVLLSIRVLRFASLFGEGTTFLDTAVQVVYRVRWWIVYIVFTGIVSSLCLGALYKPDNAFHLKHREFDSVQKSLVTTFQIIFGSFDVDYLFDADYLWVKFGFFFCFQVLMSVTVLNLLIAAMSESYHSVSKCKSIQLYRRRAQVIDELNDLRFPRWLVPEVKSYIHFLAIEKDEPENRPCPTPDAATEYQTQCIKELKEDVKTLTAKLEEMGSLLYRLAATGESLDHRVTA